MSWLEKEKKPEKSTYPDQEMLKRVEEENKILRQPLKGSELATEWPVQKVEEKPEDHVKEVSASSEAYTTAYNNELKCNEHCETIRKSLHAAEGEYKQAQENRRASKAKLLQVLGARETATATVNTATGVGVRSRY